MATQKNPNDTTQVIRFRPKIAEGVTTELQGIVTVLTGPNPGAVFELNSPTTVIGRSREVQIQVIDAGLSRRHAQILRRPDGFYIEDLGSTNGTFYNGERLNEPHKLEDGSRIQIGENTVLRFALQDKLEQEAARQMYEMTVRDPLTRLHNRRYLDERIRSEFAYALRHDSALTVLVIDVDNFKNVNDTMGHPAGDAVLRALGAGLQRMVRAEDILARFGGEEFVVVARSIDENGSTIFAERIRRNVESMIIPWGEIRLKITISIGLAHMGAHKYSSPEGLLAAADGALYQAKRGGRNRVEVA
ncbi:MAG: GGDEF domain-containing protein [Deltaproteobacteria bacterium]|nr:GGDEF domain-containing protein [Deltaproteobacteria bacterium]